MSAHELFKTFVAGKEARISDAEFDAICKEIETSPALLADAAGYKNRWVQVEASDDENAFAELPNRMSDFREIVGRNTANPNAVFLTVNVLKKYLKID